MCHGCLSIIFVMQPEISYRQVGRDSSRLIHESFLHLSPPAAFSSAEVSAVAKDTGIGADGLTGRTRKKYPKLCTQGRKARLNFPLLLFLRCCNLSFSWFACASRAVPSCDCERCRGEPSEASARHSWSPRKLVTLGGSSPEPSGGKQRSHFGAFHPVPSTVLHCPALSEPRKANVFPFNLFLLSRSHCYR